MEREQEALKEFTRNSKPGDHSQTPTGRDRIFTKARALLKRLINTDVEPLMLGIVSPLTVSLSGRKSRLWKIAMGLVAGQMIC